MTERSRVKGSALILLAVLSMGFPQEAPDSLAIKSPAIEMIPPGKMAQAREILAGEGIMLPLGGLVGIAFDPSVTDHTGLVVITLDRSLEPVKKTYTVPPSFYVTLMKGTIAESPQRREAGRLYFMVTTGLRTLSIYPASYAALLGNDDADGRTVMGLSLLTFGASLYGSYRFTKDRELGYGRVAMMNYGGELATTYSFLISRLIYGSVRYKPTVTYNSYEIYDMNGPTGRFTATYDTVASEKPGKIFAAGSVVGFPLGIYLGSRVTFAGNDQYGNADIMRFFGRSAWLYGFLIPMYGSGSDKYDYNLAASCLTMGLTPAGFYAGYKLVRGRDYSSGRGLFIETGGIMGGLTGLLVPMLFKADFDDVADRRIWISSIMAGHALGTAFGFKYKPRNSYTFFQGGFMAFSAACGAAVGLSVPFLAQSDSSNPYIIAGLLGGWGGLVAGENLAKSLFETDARDRRLSQVELSLPIVYQWPALYGKSGERDAYGRPVDRRVEVVRARVAF